ncbi:hypothetical protein CNYM01_13218 [Colletotrichum nymphaeae SA-01]|uniref:Uncharacterized protein n=1 Tax=Colletotrichum nymphaeae SA-01 TaxID=1460502 RepID=A0A135USL6_9PEZI|nr:hypothetical protein CNYM01_13218 [Colletotrichum nymphaeae SA-01]
MFLEAFVLLINSSKTLTWAVSHHPNKGAMSEPRLPVKPLSSLLASGTLGAAASQRCYRSGQASCNVGSSKSQKRARNRTSFSRSWYGSADSQRQHLSETFRVQRSPKPHSVLTRHRAGVAWRSFTLRLKQQVFANPPNRVPTPGFWVLSSDESKLTCRVRLKLSGRRGLWRGCVINLSEETATSRPRDRPRFEVDIAC